MISEQQQQQQTNQETNASWREKDSILATRQGQDLVSLGAVPASLDVLGSSYRYLAWPLQTLLPRTT